MQVQDLAPSVSFHPIGPVIKLVTCVEDQLCDPTWSSNGPIAESAAAAIRSHKGQDLLAVGPGPSLPSVNPSPDDQRLHHSASARPDVQGYCLVLVLIIGKSELSFIIAICFICPYV